MRWGICGTYGGTGEVYAGFWWGGAPDGKRPLGRPKCRWENNIKIYLQEVGWVGIDWIYPSQDRDRWRAVVNAVMNLEFP